MYRAQLLRLRPLDPGRLARELNERGARLRREGAPAQAAAQHREALAIVRDLGDQRAEALTLNNLGLALAHTGAEQAAVEYLEQAVDVLHELGDEEHEGHVIANLGVVYRRQGQGDEAATLFQEALEKLPPASPAYRQVEEELRRAG
jgi:tetratricopeptide (TPR) repeat protein